MNEFKLVSDYKPMGDQPEAIDRITEGILRGDKEQTLLGVTGSGKTFTMANIIAQVNRPTLVLAHNKTLAAQLCSEAYTASEKNHSRAEEIVKLCDEFRSSEKKMLQMKITSNIMEKMGLF